MSSATSTPSSTCTSQASRLQPTLPHLEVRVAPLPTLGEAVAVLGHPNGLPLRVSFGTVLTEDALVGGVRSVEYW